jgi:hypothetical protein
MRMSFKMGGIAYAQIQCGSTRTLTFCHGRDEWLTLGQQWMHEFWPNDNRQNVIPLGGVFPNFHSPLFGCWKCVCVCVA